MNFNEILTKIDEAIYQTDQTLTVKILRNWRTRVERHAPIQRELGKLTCSVCYNECHDKEGLGCDVPSTCNQYVAYPCPFIQSVERELQ